MRCNALLLAIALFLGGCLPRVIVRLKVYTDPEQPLAEIKAFNTVSKGKCQDNELLEKEILNLVAKRLESNGLAMDDDTPDAVVSISCELKSVQEYIPPSTTYVPVTSTSSTQTTTSGQAGSEPTKQESTSRTSTTHYIPVTSPGYYITRQQHRLKVLMETPSGKVEAQSSPIWSGEIETKTSTTDTLPLAKVMVDELLDEFPKRSGKPSARIVKIRREKPEK